MASRSQDEKNQYTCPDCQALFIHKSSFSRHKRSKCGEEKTFSCICGKELGRLDSLKRHIQVCKGKEKKPTKCEKCFVECQTNWHLNRHMKSCIDKCKDCKKIVIDSESHKCVAVLKVSLFKEKPKSNSKKSHVAENVEVPNGFYDLCYFAMLLMNRDKVWSYYDDPEVDFVPAIAPFNQVAEDPISSCDVPIVPVIPFNQVTEDPISSCDSRDMTLKPTKAYGLQIGKKGFQKADLGKVPSVFGDDSSDDDTDAKAKKSVNKDIEDESSKKMNMKQTQIEIQKALKEDPNVYEYDEVYDQMEEKKKENNQKILGGTNTDKKSKYISKLVKSAELRKMEDERRKERKIQKERDEEGDEFAEKEEFVTSGYRQKIEERAAEAEKMKKQDALDAVNDVTKQKDLSMFYRNLLDKNVAMGAEKEEPEVKVEKEKVDVKTDVKSEVDQESSDAEVEDEREKKSEGKKKSYRKKQRYSESSSDEEKVKKEEKSVSKKVKIAKRKNKNEEEIQSIEAELRELQEKEELHKEKRRRKMEQEESFEEFKERRRREGKAKKEVADENIKEVSSKKYRKKTKYEDEESSNSDESDMKELEKINKKLNERKHKKKMAEKYSDGESYSEGEMKKKGKNQQKFADDFDVLDKIELKINKSHKKGKDDIKLSSEDERYVAEKRSKKVRKEEQYSSSDDEKNKKRRKSQSKTREKHIKKKKNKYEDHSSDGNEDELVDKKKMKKRPLSESKTDNITPEVESSNTTETNNVKKHIFSRRNTPETIAAAKERYLARLQNLRSSEQTIAQDSD